MKREPEKMTIPLRGLVYRITVTTREQLAEMAPVRLRFEREPNNSHDPNAIAVFAMEPPKKSNWHIGYVPKEIAALLAPKLDNGTVHIESVWLTEVEPESGEAEMDVFFKTRKTKTGAKGKNGLTKPKIGT
jgi:hypothetical protein